MGTLANAGSRFFIAGQMDKAERAATDIVSFAGRIRTLSELDRDRDLSDLSDLLAWVNLACERCTESERYLRECLEWLAKEQSRRSDSPDKPCGT